MSTDLIFPSAVASAETVLAQDRQNTMVLSQAVSPSPPIPSSSTSSHLTKVDSPHRRLGVIRRVSPKEILHFLKASNPLLQRTLDARKYDFEKSLEDGKIRYPPLETKVAALFSTAATSELREETRLRTVKEGSDCVSLFDETNFYSDECKSCYSNSGYI